jgi:dipeptidase
MVQQLTMLRLLVGLPLVFACSNILVTPGASADGTAMVGDNDDASSRHGLVTHFDAGDWPAGTKRPVYDFESSRYLGEIDQPEKTFSTISHANEKGVVIAETTQGGLRALSQRGKDYRNGTVLDYGSLIIATLQRAGTAREAVTTIANLTDTYGYASDMEGFSITDGQEAWYMELLGKGDYGTGLLWVALRVPDGYVTANANQARITTFLPCTDPKICMAAPDVVPFAIKHGLFNGSADDPSFSFSDTYDPVTAFGARFCEARVWFMFSRIADPTDFNASYYLPYAQGFDLSRRMPLWVKPKAKLSRATVHELLSSAYQDTWLDPSQDVGAGAEHSPYRWNGLSWNSGSDHYVNERVVGTQFTAWHFVASVSADADVPAPMRALMWWGADDHQWAPKVPIFGGATRVDRTYDDGNCSARLACRQALGLPGSMMDFSWDSAFWVNSAGE